MSVLQSRLSAISPWCYATPTPASVCHVTCAPYIGLNDPINPATASLQPIITQDTPTPSTANITNLACVSISIFEYGRYVESIATTTENQLERPSQCDFVLHTSEAAVSASFRRVLLAEVKVCDGDNYKRKRKAQNQLQHSLQDFFAHVPEMQNAAIRCSFFHCPPCFFRNGNTDTPPHARKAAQGVSRVAAQTKRGIQKKRPGIDGYAEYWEYPYGHICDFFDGSPQTGISNNRESDDA